MELEPIEPDTAVELYLADRETELAKATIDAHRCRLNFFAEWCDDRDIANLNELPGRNIQEYRLWRRNDGNLSPPSENSHMDIIRVFIKWPESIDGAPQDIHQKIRSPTVDPQEGSRDVMPDNADAEAILEYLETYEYASLDHVILSLLWRTMIRLGAANSLDVEDYDPEEQSLAITHRPETGTPLKNQRRGERLVALSGWTCTVLDDWIRDQRPDVTDEHGRQPLVASVQGRLAKSTIRKYVYRWTRPCAFGQSCPHDRDPASCDGTQGYTPSQCPSSVSPHAIRRGSITHHLKSDVPETAVGDRANVSQDILEKHYDRRSKREKMEQRRQYLDNI